MSTSPNKESPSTLTEKTPALPVSHVKVIINDDETVEVDSRAEQHYYIGEAGQVNETAMKCKGCKMVTVQEQFEFAIKTVTTTDSITKRVALCTSCGQFGQ